MKKMKRIVALLLTACLLLVGIVFSVTSGAVDYTGNLVEYSALLDAVDAAEGAVAKVAALEKADKYLAENPINPEDEGYQAALDRAAAIKTATDALKMTELGALYTAYGNVSDTAEKRESIEAIYAFIDAVKADDTLDGFAALKAQIDASYTALKTEEILGFIENVGVSADRYATMTEFFDFAVQKGFTDEDYTAAGKLSEISALEIECVKNKLDTTVQLEDIDTKTNVIALNRVRALMADLVLDQTAAGYTEFKTAFDTAVAAHEAQKAINYEELLLDSWYVHYGEKNQFDYSFQDTLKPSFITKNLANSYIRVESGEDPISADNKYVTVFHSRQDALDGAGNVGKGNHIYTSDSLVAGKKGFVVEVDITTFGEWVANGTYSNVKCAGVTVDGESFTLSNGKYLALWCIDGKGNLGASRESVTAGKVFMENVIVPGQWLHLTCVFNPDKPADERLALYVDYELVATFDPNPEVKTFEISEIRVGQQNVEGEFSLDNFSFNWGGSVRDEAWFNALSDDERFIYISDYLYKDHSITSLLLASEDGKKLVGAYASDVNEDGVPEYLTEDPALRLAVDKFFAFDAEKLIIEAKENNLSEYMAAVERALAIERNVSTIDQRQTAVNSVNALDTGYGSYIDRQDERYIAYLTIVNTLSTEVADDIVIRDFTTYMTRFGTAATVVSLQKHYDSATVEYNRFTAGVRAMIGADGYEDFTNAYIAYGEARGILDDAMRKDNAKKIIACVEFIKEFEDEAAWSENAEFINKYILIIRDTLKLDYDKDYEGLSEALAIYEPINAYFFNLLQQEHITAISTELAKFNTTNSYIEKMGICAYVTRYVAKNDLDENNEELNALLATHRAYILELEQQESDYFEVLEQNTSLFVDVVNSMMLATDYAQIKNLQSQAEVYYFTMNAGSVIAKDAVAAYEEYTAMIDTLDQLIVLFSGYVDELKLKKTDDEIYYSLVDCAAQLGMIEVIIDAYNLNGFWDATRSLDAARDAYDTAYTNYIKGVNNANSDIEQAQTATFAVRSGMHNSVLVAIFYKFIFG